MYCIDISGFFHELHILKALLYQNTLQKNSLNY